MKRRSSLLPVGGLRGRLALSHFLVASAALLVVALWLPRVVQAYQIAGLERQLADEARLARRVVEPSLASRPPPVPAPDSALQRLIRQIGQEVGARVTVIDRRGRVLADSLHDPATMENHANRPELQKALKVGLGQSLRYSRTLGMNRLYVAVPIWSDQGGILGAIRLSLSLDEIHRSVRHLRNSLLLLLLLVALGAVALSSHLAYTFVRPLRLLRDAALGLAQGDLAHRVVLRPRDEIGDLAEAFDQMTTRLQATIAELAWDRSQMRTVFDTMADGLLVTDSTGRVRLLNPAAAAMWGVTAAGAVGKTVLETTLDAPVQSLVDEVLRTGAAAVRERLLRTPVERAVTVSAVPIGRDGETGGNEGAVLVFHDQTAARRVERMRRDFVANASHELRTPLASMRVMVETLMNSAREDPEAAHHFLEILDRELHRMTALVNDLLELSRLDARVEAPPTESISLAPLVAELESGWQAVAQDRELQLALSVPETLAVRGEAQGVRQILANLLDNALKYTPAGGQVHVSARKENGHVLLEVADTGIGIPTADLDRIFERFYRVDRDRSRDLGGTGLGLSIVKHLAQLYGGAITVESRLNRGSTFRVRLPRADSEPAPRPARRADDLMT